jgi:hypothetical protein
MVCYSRLSTVRLVIVVILILRDNQRMGTLICFTTETQHKENNTLNAHHSRGHDCLVESHKEPGSESGAITAIE